jgi:hypothetical protein
MTMSILHTTRRAALRSLVGGSLALPAILSELLADDKHSNPLAPKKPHFEPKAKRVIFLFSTGGVSHLDTFDPKPRVINADGKAKAIGGGLSDEQRPLLRAGWAYKPGGKCGTQVSDLFPNLREKMDDVCLVGQLRPGHG